MNLLAPVRGPSPTAAMLSLLSRARRAVGGPLALRREGPRSSRRSRSRSRSRARRCCDLLLLVVLSGLVMPAAAIGFEGAHPLDGPDADIRVIIGNQSVVMNIGVNLVFMDDLVNVPRETPGDLHEVEHPAAARALFDYFRADNSVTIDGVAVPPVYTDFMVDYSSLSMIPLFPRTGRRGVIKAAVVLTYPLKSPPQQVSIVWGTFPLDLDQTTETQTFYREIQAQVVASGMSEIVRFTREEPQYIWHAPADDAGSSPADHLMAVPEPSGEATMQWPVVSFVVGAAWVGLAGFVLVRPSRRNRIGTSAILAGLPIAAALAWWLSPVWVVETASPFAAARRLPSEAEARAIFQPLHTNIYRAFDYVDESDVYDALDQSVDGPLLDTLYNQIYRSLIMQDQGGAVSRVESVKPIETEVTSIGLLPPDDHVGFSVRTRWQVEGAVYHWGHSHTRTNEYLAEYAVIETDAGWRIADNRVLEQKRISQFDGGGPAMPGPVGDGLIPNPFTTPPADAAEANEGAEDGLLDDEI